MVMMTLILPPDQVLNSHYLSQDHRQEVADITNEALLKHFKFTESIFKFIIRYFNNF